MFGIRHINSLKEQLIKVFIQMAEDQNFIEKAWQSTKDFASGVAEDVSEAVDSVGNFAEELNASVVSAVTPKSQQTAEELAARAKKYGTPRILRYPSNVEQEEQPHSVRFRIKVREQSKIGRALQSTASEDNPVQYEESNQNRTSAENYGDFLGGSNAIVAAGGALALAKGGSGAIQKGLFAAAAGTIGYAGGKTVGDANMNRTIKTNTFIQLYIPQAPTTAYSAQWQDAELGAIVGMLAKGTDAGLMEILKSSGEFAAREVASRAGDVAKSLGLNLDTRAAIQAASRKVENPNREQLFKTMNFRDFAFEYKFAPRNQKEFTTTMEIIQEFKVHMHSEKQAGGMYLIYPSEFDIEFQYKGKRNTYVNRIASCALTDVKVTYGSGGTFTTFKDLGGAPSEITMQLAFKELEILTRDMIEEGY